MKICVTYLEIIISRPQGNGRKCEGPEKKYQSCSAQQCIKVPKLTIREFADQICTRAREVDKDLTGNGIQKISSDREYFSNKLNLKQIK